MTPLQYNTTRRVLLLLILAGFLIVPGSAWLDHFTADTSGSYDYDSTWEWQIVSSRLRNTNAPWTGAAYYTDETFGSGTYEISYTPQETYLLIHMVYGDVDHTLGSPSANGEHYIVIINNAGPYVGIAKRVGGVLTHICNDENLTLGSHIITLEWDIPTGHHLVYIDGNPSEVCHITDTDITDPGYFGVASIMDKWMYFDYISFTSSGTPTPTPTPTTYPTTYPIIPTEQPGTGLYIGGDALPVGIISGIFLTLDQQPFLLAAIVILIAGLVLRRR